MFTSIKVQWPIRPSFPKCVLFSRFVACALSHSLYVCVYHPAFHSLLSSIHVLYKYDTSWCNLMIISQKPFENSFCTIFRCCLVGDQIRFFKKCDINLQKPRFKRASFTIETFLDWSNVLLLIWWFAFHMCCYFYRVSLVTERKKKQQEKSSYKNSKKTFRIAWTKQIMCIIL